MDKFEDTSLPDRPQSEPESASPPPDVLTRPAFHEGLRALASLGLSFDAWMYHTQLNELTMVARAHPEATIVLNHVGGAIGIVGAYEDEVVRTPDGWRFAARTFKPDPAQPEPSA